ncbi:hypothetical protein D3C71_1263120 [compost metagenome]
MVADTSRSQPHQKRWRCAASLWSLRRVRPVPRRHMRDAASVPSPMPWGTMRTRLCSSKESLLHARSLQVLAPPAAQVHHPAVHLAVGQPVHQCTPLPRQGGAGVFWDHGQLSAIDGRRGAPGCAAGPAGRAARRPCGAVHAELPAAGDCAFRHPAGQCGGGARQSHEPGRGAQALHYRPRHQDGDHHG